MDYKKTGLGGGKILVSLLFQIVVLFSTALGQQTRAWLTVYAPQMTEKDTIVVRVWDDYLFEKSINTHRVYTALNKSGTYYITIDSLPGMCRMSLALSYQKKKGNAHLAVLEDYLVTPGDSIAVKMSARQGVMRPSGGYDGGEPVMLENWACDFSGKGSLKYQVRFNMDDLSGKRARKDMSINPYPMSASHLRAKWNIERADSLMERQLDYLQRFAEDMPQGISLQLKADVIGRFSLEKTESVKNFILLRGLTTSQQNFVSELAKERVFFSEGGMDSILFRYAAKSPIFITYARMSCELEYWFTKNNRDLDSMFEWVADRLEIRPLKDRVLTALLIYRFDTAPSPEIWSRAKGMIYDPFCLKWVDKLGKILPGRKMPDFSLPDVYGKYHGMDQLAGKVVFLDFWYAACVPCRRYMQEVLLPLADQFENDERVRFLTISTDKMDVLIKTLQSSDVVPRNTLKLYTDGLRFDHPLIKYFGIIAYPAPILVGKDGRILASGSDLKSKEALLAQIQRALDN